MEYLLRCEKRRITSAIAWRIQWYQESEEIKIENRI
jgi:hypothetical protein